MVHSAALVVGGGVPTAAGAQQLAPAAPSLVFEGVTVIDVDHGTLLPAQRVVITGTRIQAMGSGREVPLPKDAQVVDARGKYLIPGLWDMHIHPMRDPDFFFPLLIATGVTGIRDAGSQVPLDTLLQWRQEILAGTRVGPPRQLNSSKYIAGLRPGCKREPTDFEVCIADSADARHYVDSLKAAGADMIKVHGIPLDQIFVVANEARRVGLRVGGHIDFTAQGLAAADSGVGIFDHTEYGGLDSLCLRRQVASVATCQPVAERFRHYNTWWVPTIVNNGPYGEVTSLLCERLNTLTREFWNGTPFNRTAWLAQLRVPPDSHGYLTLAQRVGMPLLVGTDAAAPTIEPGPGFSVQAEMVAYVTEGVTPLGALQAATLNPAKFLAATDSLGTVAPGKLADLVLLDGDPLADIANVAAIQAVVANGRYYDRGTLDGLLTQLQAKAQRDGAPWDR